jgi:hypothetical protein
VERCCRWRIDGLLSESWARGVASGIWFDRCCQPSGRKPDAVALEGTDGNAGSSMQGLWLNHVVDCRSAGSDTAEMALR